MSSDNGFVLQQHTDQKFTLTYYCGDPFLPPVSEPGTIDTIDEGFCAWMEAERKLPWPSEYSLTVKMLPPTPKLDNVIEINAKRCLVPSHHTSENCGCIWE